MTILPASDWKESTGASCIGMLPRPTLAAVQIVRRVDWDGKGASGGDLKTLQIGSHTVLALRHFLRLKNLHDKFPDRNSHQPLLGPGEVGCGRLQKNLNGWGQNTTLLAHGPTFLGNLNSSVFFLSSITSNLQVLFIPSLQL